VAPGNNASPFSSLCGAAIGDVTLTMPVISLTIHLALALAVLVDARTAANANVMKEINRIAWSSFACPTHKNVRAGVMLFAKT
jgi:hypothetical protein